MKQTLQTYLLSAAQTLLTEDKEQIDYILRVTKGKLTREENSTSHCCAMILPYDPMTNDVFLVHHKKANSWLFPGGHIDLDELPIETAIRETEEELGIKNAKIEGPFGMKILSIMNPRTPCRKHYDIFYSLPVNSTSIIPDNREFFASEWVSIPEAMKRIEYDYYRHSLRQFRVFKNL